MSLVSDNAYVRHEMILHLHSSKFVVLYMHIQGQYGIPTSHWLVNKIHPKKHIQYYSQAWNY